MPARSARANFAAWPAHICILSVSPAFCASSRIKRVSPRWIGYGAGEGTFEATEARMRAGANVWSAAILQAINATGKLVCANVFGLCWRTACSWP
jgi:hypothetical protein